LRSLSHPKLFFNRCALCSPSGSSSCVVVSGANSLRARASECFLFQTLSFAREGLVFREQRAVVRAGNGFSAD
jgi:hypothetical protein